MPFRPGGAGHGGGSRRGGDARQIARRGEGGVRVGAERVRARRVRRRRRAVPVRVRAQALPGVPVQRRRVVREVQATREGEAVLRDVPREGSQRERRGAGEAAALRHQPASRAAATAAATATAAARWSRRGRPAAAAESRRGCAVHDRAAAPAAASAAATGADRDRDEGPRRHRLQAAGRDDLPQRQAPGCVRQDALARLAGIEAGPPDPGVQGMEARGARDQPALRQADRRLHRAVRGALPRLGRADLERSRGRRVHRPQGDRGHRPDAVHRPPEAGQAHDLRRAFRLRARAARASRSRPARPRSTASTCSRRRRAGWR